MPPYREHCSPAGRQRNTPTLRWLRSVEYAGRSALVVVPVLPGQEDALVETLDPIGRDPASNAILPFGKMARLHFCSPVIIPYNKWDPRSLLMFEGDVDGPVADFLKDLVDVAGDGVDAVFRHCEGFPSGAADRLQ